MILFPDNLVLASASPRRQQLMKEAGFRFEVIVKNIDESYPNHLKREEVAIHIASKKADAYNHEIEQGMVIITADTIVCVDDAILGKPGDRAAATEMLKLLSGRSHEVITAVCIRSRSVTDCFYERTVVRFRDLSSEEIDYYVEHFKPFDKAGAYGIQEWIGLVAITGIEGSYHNVVGLPVAGLYSRLMKHYNEADS